LIARCSKIAVLVALMCALVGCATPLTRETMQLEPVAVPAAAGLSLRVVPELTGRPPVRFNAHGPTHEADLDALSAILSGIVEDSLRASGATISEDGARIGLRVSYIDLMFPKTCMLDFSVHLESVRPFGLQTYGSASSKPHKACGRAFETAAEAIFSDPRTRNELGAP